MSLVGDAESRRVRGRVVMLVDNGVQGDSRVQKAAASAASAGWEVILLGRSPDGQPHTWQIGQAEVRLVPTPSPLSKRPYEFRRNWLRRPFAYPPTGIAAYRAQRIKGWQADIGVRRATLRLAALSGTATPLTLRLRGTALRGESFVARCMRRWVSFRYRQLTMALKGRRRLDGPWDRATMTFWRAVMGDRSWRRLEPRLWDFELAFGTVVDRLKPDLIHANDFYMLGVGARAVIRARAARRQVKLVWDAHELVAGLKSRADNVRWLPAHVAHEREYARYADAAITVSDELAAALQAQHGLPERPTVVLNAPDVGTDGGSAAPAPDLRVLCGVGAEVPVLVYSGAAAPQRGLSLMIDAMPQIEDVHVALVVAQPPSRYVLGLAARAAELGAADRLHLLPYVPHDQVVSFLAGADAGVIPIQHWPNHEIALITKFFEYAHARLPMIVSDVRTMAETTRTLGQGEVFRADDIEDYVRAVKLVLADSPRYRAAYDRPGLLESWTWRAQAKVLDDVYSRLLPERAQATRVVQARTHDVSVVLPVHNAIATLPRCIRSLVEQSIGLDRFEVVAVDDGSTDGSTERLGSFAKKYPETFRVIHQTAAGAPAAAFNRGLDAATGRYVLVLSASDRLAPEALERLVSTADERGSDVVLGRVAGTAGGRPAADIFGETARDVDTAELFETALPFAMSYARLFRRSLIERLGLRYRDDLPGGGDQPFTLEACLRASGISVLGAYDCFLAARRSADGSLVSADPLARVRATELLMGETARLLEPGPRRDAINLRHFGAELSDLLGPELVDRDPTTRENICRNVGRLVAEYLTDAISERLDVGQRLRLALAHRGHLDDLMDVIQQDTGPDRPPILVDGNRLFAGYRCFRDSRLGLPDSIFQLTGEAARWLAARIEMTQIGWETDADRGQVLNLVARSPIDLIALDVEEPTVAVGDVSTPARLETVSDGRSGTVLRASLPLGLLVADCPRSKDRQRREVRVRLAVQGTHADAPLRVPAGLPTSMQFGRRGGRLYRFRPTRTRAGLLVLDVLPVTARRVLGRARRLLRPDRRT